MKKLSYDDYTILFDQPSCMQDNCFAVVDELHFDRIFRPDANQFIVNIYSARDCCNMSYAHASYYSKEEFLVGFLFDTAEAATGFMSKHITLRMTDVAAHDELLRTLVVGPKQIDLHEREALFSASGEMRDSRFAVVHGLHFDRVDLPGAHAHLVTVYDATDCYNLSDAHSDHYDESAFVTCFLFDNERDADAYMIEHITQRTLDFNAHEDRLLSMGITLPVHG